MGTHPCPLPPASPAANPALAKVPLFLSGESFAGHYLPAIAVTMQMSASFPLAGVAMGNPCVSSPAVQDSYFSFGAAHGLLTSAFLKNVSVAWCSSGWGALTAASGRREGSLLAASRRLTPSTLAPHPASPPLRPLQAAPAVRKCKQLSAVCMALGNADMCSSAAGFCSGNILEPMLVQPNMTGRNYYNIAVRLGAVWCRDCPCRDAPSGHGSACTRSHLLASQRF